MLLYHNLSVRHECRTACGLMTRNRMVLCIWSQKKPSHPRVAQKNTFSTMSVQLTTRRIEHQCAECDYQQHQQLQGTIPAPPSDSAASPLLPVSPGQSPCKIISAEPQAPYLATFASAPGTRTSMSLQLNSPAVGTMFSQGSGSPFSRCFLDCTYSHFLDQCVSKLK